MSLKQLLHLTPAGLIEARLQAVTAGRFGLIYDSYHPQSAFRQQFPLRKDYLRFAAAAALQQCHLLDYQLVQQWHRADHAEVLFWLRLQAPPRPVDAWLELAELDRTVHGWRYRCGYRLSWPEPPAPDTVDPARLRRDGLCF